MTFLAIVGFGALTAPLPSPRDYLFVKKFCHGLPARAAANCAYETPSPHSSPREFYFIFPRLGWASA
jgi:hypothetical protein